MRYLTEYNGMSEIISVYTIVKLLLLRRRRKFYANDT